MEIGNTMRLRLKLNVQFMNKGLNEDIVSKYIETSLLWNLKNRVRATVSYRLLPLNNFW